MQINYLLWEYFINFLETLLFFIFVNTKLNVKTKCKHPKVYQFIYLAFQFIMLCILNHINISTIIAISITWMLDVAFTVIFYEDSIITRFLMGSMYSIICMISEFITMSVPQVFFGVSVLEILFGGALRMPFTLLYIVLIAVQVFLLNCMSNKKIAFTLYQKISYTIISISGILIGHFILVITLSAEELFHNSDFTLKLILVNLVFLLLFLCLLLYIFQLGYSKALNASLLEQQKIHELEEMEYKTLINASESLREMKHDINIHLDVIQSLSENGNNDECKEYIDKYRNSIANTHHLLSTGNTAIDCIVSKKLDEAEKLGINTDYSVIVRNSFPLDAVSLSSLLGNMWNNALEACQRLKESKPDIVPYINFYIKPYQNMVVIHMENNYDEINLKNNHYKTMKKRGMHGIGLNRIKTIVAESDGIIKITSDKHIFKVHIMIPQGEENEI